MLRRSPGGLPGALCKTSKSIPRYSKTRLFCQERAKIFQNKPLKAPLLERKPGSLQERMPQIARASLKGWAAVPRRMASWIKSMLDSSARLPTGSGENRPHVHVSSCDLGKHLIANCESGPLRVERLLRAEASILCHWIMTGPL